MPDSDLFERTTRLQEAVANAGGPGAVAKRANMPVTSLNNYLAGRDMKVSALVSLAGACNVNIEWLAAGKGSRKIADASAPTVKSFSADQLAREANFRALIMVLFACKEFYDRLGSSPTLAETRDWIGPHYSQFQRLKDGPIEIKPFTDPAL